MPRTKRLIFEGGVFHILTRGNNRQQLFHSEQDYRVFLKHLAQGKEKFPYLLYHYTLMPNHVHLLVEVCQPRDLSKAMQKTLQSYSLYFQDKYDFVGHAWQGRYKSILLEKDHDLLACGRYIELNPVRSGLANHPASYPWSSYPVYACENKNSPCFLNLNPVYFSLGNTPEKQRQIYAQWTQETDWRNVKNKLGLNPDLSRPGRPKKIGTVPFSASA